RVRREGVLRRAGLGDEARAARDRRMSVNAVTPALDAQEAIYRVLAEHASDSISVTTPAGVITYISPAVGTISGYSPEELTGRSVFEMVHPDDLVRVRDVLADALGRADTFTTQCRLRRKDGAYIWAESTARAIRDERDGSVREFVVVTRDITERQRLI